MFCTFWLGYVLRATMACNFSSLIWRNFSPAALASLQPTFRPSGATNQWKNTVFRLFRNFSRTWIFFLRRLSLFDLLSSSLPFSSLTLRISAFHLSILSEVWLLNVLRQIYYATLRYTNYTTLHSLHLVTLHYTKYVNNNNNNNYYYYYYYHHHNYNYNFNYTTLH